MFAYVSFFKAISRTAVLDIIIYIIINDYAYWAINININIATAKSYMCFFIFIIVSRYYFKNYECTQLHGIPTYTGIDLHK